MENNSVFLDAARHGKLEQFKNSAISLDPLNGDGIEAVIENSKNGVGRGALHTAAAGGNVDVLKYLIQDLKLDVNLKDGKGKTPLSLAAKKGRLAAVEYLLEMGANPEIPDDSNTGPFLYAAWKGHKDVLPLFLSKGIDVDARNELGSPLELAAGNGYHDTVKVLLEHGANPNLVFDDAYTPLQASIRTLSWQCMVLLLKAGADPNVGRECKPLTIAADVGVIHIIKLLVKYGADPNSIDHLFGLKPIELAAVKQNRPAVEFLFPVTSHIPSYGNWSINGIMKHVKSKKFKEKMIRKENEMFLEAKSRGTSAFQRKEYSLAEHWYSEALIKKPGDAAVLANRSLCYVYLNKGEDALEDAEQCVLAEPGWAKAHYRKGEALKLLNRLDDAAVAFSDALKLSPENEEIQDAFREVTLDRLKALNVTL